VDLHDRHDMLGLSPDARALRIRLLGEFSISCNGTYVDASAWRFHNARRLVQILALMPGYRVHREQVTDWFWSDSESKSASNNLHQVLHHARRALKSTGFDGQLLRLDRNVLSLDVPERELWIDVDVFESAAHDAQHHKNLEHYLAALALYSGELLPEERYADWTAARREALHSTYLALLLQLGEIQEARGALSDAEGTYSRLVVADRSNESGHAGLMRVYALTGRRHQSLAQYRELDEILRRELDVEPGPELVELRDEIGRGIYQTHNPAGAFRPIAAPFDAAFVGRERELQVLRDALERSFSGRGQVLMLTGEPGAGKTRTARELAAYARASGSSVLWGSCYDGDGAPAYWPWVQIIRQAIEAMDQSTLRHVLDRGAAAIGQILPEIQRLLPDAGSPVNIGAEQARFQLFDSITGFFKLLSLRTPLLLILDDLHWSDRSTLLLLSFLAREVDHSRVVILGTYRDTELDGDHPLSPALAEMSRSSALQRLSLSGLSEADVRRLIQSSVDQALPDGTAKLVFQRTEGNPFFIGEVLRMLREEDARDATATQSWETEVPQGVRDVIGLRLSRLSAACGDVLAGAAVVGREFNLNVLDLIVGGDRWQVLDALDEALSARLIEKIAASDGMYQFSHALVHETVYSGLSSARRADLHRRTGEAFEQLYAGEIEQYLNELAHHFLHAAVGGSVGPAVAYGIRAGDQALARIAYSEALSHYQRTLDVIESYEPAARAELLEVLLKLGDAHNHVGNRAEARATFHRAANVSRELNLSTHFARAALGFAGLGLFLVGEDQRALLEEAVALLPEDDSILRARALARLAFEFQYIPPLERRIKLIQEAELMASRIGDPSTLIYVLIAKNWTIETLDNLEERVAVTEEVLTLVEQSGEVLLAPTSHAMRFYDGLETGNIDAVDRQIARFKELADRSREPQRQWLALIFRATRAVLVGDVPEAERVIALAHDLARDVMSMSAHDHRVVSLLIAMRREQDRLDEIEDMLAAVVGRRAGNFYWRVKHVCVASELSGSDDFGSDIEALIDEIEQLPRLDIDQTVAVTMLAMASYVRGRPQLAQKLYVRVQPYCGRYLLSRITYYPYGPVDYYAGVLAGAMGYLDDAEGHLQQAIEMNERMPARPYLARSQYELASVLLRRDGPADRERAMTLLDAAQDLATEVGMTVLLKEIRARRSLARVGA
jgi:DNA-binding SARP family transcriptional activator